MTIKLKMHKVTKDEVAKNWHKQYFKNGDWAYGKNKRQTYEAIKALPETASPEDIVKVVGNNSWTHNRCSICSDSTNRYFEIKNVNGHYTTICLACASSISSSHAKAVNDYPEEFI